VSFVPSTPHYPQSNGLAESAVKSMKKLVIWTVPNGDLDNEVFLQALVKWRNTLRHHGASPTQIVFEHPIRSLVPAHHRSFSAEWQQSMAYWNQRAAVATDRAAQRCNERARSFPPLRIGTPVRVQDTDMGLWDQIRIGVGIGDRQDYRIKKPSGRVLWRNRSFLRTDHTQEARPPALPSHLPVTFPSIPASDVIPTPTGTDPPFPPPPRRSTRVRKPPRRFATRSPQSAFCI
jgi:hypothetical protein